MKNLTITDVKNIILQILKLILQRTIDDLIGWINTYVPKATGELQRTIISSIKQSAVYNGRIVLVFGSNLEYASKVNDYSTSQVAHSGEKRYLYKGLPPITLNDPSAIGHWFDELKKYAKERLAYNSDNVTREILGTVSNIISGVIEEM